MKKNLGSNLLLVLASAALLYTVIANPPGGIRWGMIVEEPAPLLKKASYLASSYLWPALLAFLAISLFQLQFRVSASGATKRAVFAMSVFASGSMLLALRTLAFTPNSSPSYVTGMAAAYTVMSRLYAVRLKEVFRGVRIPWPIWRGNLAAVEELNRVMRSRAENPPASR
jgi:hypothetical protein